FRRVLFRSKGWNHVVNQLIGLHSLKLSNWLHKLKREIGNLVIGECLLRAGKGSCQSESSSSPLDQLRPYTVLFHYPTIVYTGHFIQFTQFEINWRPCSVRCASG